MKANTLAVVGDSILAAQLQLPLLPIMNKEYAFILHKDNEKLSLLWQDHDPPLTLLIDFLQGPLAYRQQQALTKEAIVKACGIKHDYHPVIVDATAGLGRDAFILASLHCKVLLFESHPVIAALLQDGLQRLLDKQALNMQLTLGNACELLTKLDEDIDVVYLDPMFPPRNKTALVKKDMQILQKLTEELPIDNEALFQAAYQTAKKRVVVKRPSYAPTLTTTKPSFEIKSNYHRFDVYSHVT